MAYYPNTEWGRLLAALDSQDKKRLEAMRTPPVKATAPATEMVVFTPVKTDLNKKKEWTLQEKFESFANVVTAVGLVLVALVLYGASL